ncbi:MAG TPA: zf-HC2 domain-containing protein [Thermomicrobiales bacterium]|nr:zf-HC2 domain-containing protein [Thermomicrobiales bacterium]
MDCRDARRALHALLGDELVAPEAARVREHLAACPSCRRLYETYRQDEAALGRFVQAAPWLPVAGRLWDRLPAARARRVAGRIPLGPGARGLGRVATGVAYVALLAVAGLLAALVVSGMVHHSGPPAPGTAGAASGAAVPAAQPADCTEAGIQQLVRRFLNAYNRGDQGHLAAFFPTKSVQYLTFFDIPPGNDAFLKYTVNTRVGPTFGTDDPRELPAYFAQRHQRHERLSLMQLHVQNVPNPSIVEFFLTRQADDEPEQILYGQGRLNCERQWITSWAVTDAPTPLAAATPTIPSYPVTVVPYAPTYPWLVSFQPVGGADLDGTATLLPTGAGDYTLAASVSGARSVPSGPFTWLLLRGTCASRATAPASDPLVRETSSSRTFTTTLPDEWVTGQLALVVRDEGDSGRLACADLPVAGARSYQPVPGSRPAVATLTPAPGRQVGGRVHVWAAPGGGGLLRVELDGPADEPVRPSLLWFIRGGSCAESGAVPGPHVFYKVDPQRRIFSLIVPREWHAATFSLSAYVEGGGPLVTCADLPLTAAP